MKKCNKGILGKPKETEDMCSNCDNYLGDALCQDKDGNFYSPCDKFDMKRSF